MSSVWLTIPSARPPAEANPVLEKWRAQGYKIALWRDDAGGGLIADSISGSHGNYPGYALAVNALVRDIIIVDPDAQWFVAGGDDTEPDLNHTADEIAAQCNQHFSALHYAGPDPGRLSPVEADTYGVMQPTGDRFASGQIDRICGSPWMGREFCRRINQGRGPLWPEYTHMWVDEEIQRVAEKYGIFWQRRDLIHLHRHFMRESDAINSPAVGGRETPAHLVEANSREHWMKYEKLFKERRAAGFPGSEPL